MNVRIGRLSWLLAPGYSHCGRCLTNWRFVEGHTTMYTDSSGCFPLCEQCWAELKPRDRLPYYRDLWRSWYAEASTTGRRFEIADKWPQIERAVLIEEAAA